MSRACGTLIRVYHAYSLIILVHLSWGSSMHEFITIKVVSCFPLLKQTCVFEIIKMATEVKASAKGDLNIWKLPLLYSLSRAVHRVGQRKQFTFVSRVQNQSRGETQSVGKDKVHRGWICIAMLKNKLQWITFNPSLLERILALATCGRKVYNCLQDKG